MRIFLLLLLLCLAQRVHAQKPVPPPFGYNYAYFFYVPGKQADTQESEKTLNSLDKITGTLAEGYSITSVTVKNASKKILLEEIDANTTGNGPADQLLFYFSMETYYDPKKDQAYLLPADAEYKELKTETFLAIKDLLPFFARSKAKHILVVFDGGQAGNFSLSRKKSATQTEEAFSETDCFSFKTSMDFAGRQYLSVVNPAEWNAAAFADQFEQALSKNAALGLLSFEELLARLTKSSGLSLEYGTFEGHSAGGNFFFRRSGVCETPVSRGDERAPDDDEDIAAPMVIIDVPYNKRIDDKTAYANALKLNTEAGYRAYLEQSPNGNYKSQINAAMKLLDDAALRKLDEAAWETALKKNTKAAFSKYLKDQPKGLHRLDAQEMLKFSVELLQQNARPDHMVFIKGGIFTMGSNEEKNNEAPEQTLSVDDFYMSKFEVTVEEYQAFVEATGYKTDAEKENRPWGFDGIQQREDTGRNWRKDNFGNDAHTHHPVTHVSWNDAMEYCKWLSKKTGKSYRLPTEAEWEYAAGNGSKHTRFSWGSAETLTEKSENLADETARQVIDFSVHVSDYFDGTVFVAHVGSYAPNSFGLYDMGGNVSEWCLDRYAYHYLPKATFSPGNGYRTVRGGNWYSWPKESKVTERHMLYHNKSRIFQGFRVLREKD